MRVNDFLLGCIMAVFGAAVILHAAGFPEMAGMAYGPAFFPTLIGAGFAVCGLSLIAGGALARYRGRVEPLFQPPDWMSDRVAVLRAACVPLTVAFYVLAVPFLGFLTTVFAASLALLLVLGNRLPISLTISLILPVLLHYGFSIALRVPLPRGPLERLLF